MAEKSSAAGSLALPPIPSSTDAAEAAAGAGAGSAVTAFAGKIALDGLGPMIGA
jgi:hypothetical protein